LAYLNLTYAQPDYLFLRESRLDKTQRKGALTMALIRFEHFSIR